MMEEKLAQIRLELLADLRRDEGLRKIAYPDPLSGGNPWTIGYGHTGPEVKRGGIWTQEQCDAALLSDAQKHAEELCKAAPWVLDLDPVRQDVLFNMAFNLGIRKLLAFKNTLAMVRAGKYDEAARNMLLSAWAKQVGARAKRLSEMMRKGARL